MAPVLAINHNVNEFHFAAAGTGGAAAATAVAQVAAGTMIAGGKLNAAMAAPRIRPVAGGRILYEPKLSPAAVQLLARLGSAEPRVSPGRVNAIYCSGGLPPNPDSCAVASDPRGFGLAANANQ
jgi:gamma-glutamyltranspeptidase/glutathione hydrolase